MKLTMATMNKQKITNTTLDRGVEIDGGSNESVPLNLFSVAGLAKSPEKMKRRATAMARAYGKGVRILSMMGQAWELASIG